jgi:hypothetical protein
MKAMHYIPKAEASGVHMSPYSEGWTQMFEKYGSMYVHKMITVI